MRNKNFLTVYGFPNFIQFRFSCCRTKLFLGMILFLSKSFLHNLHNWDVFESLFIHSLHWFLFTKVIFLEKICNSAKVILWNKSNEQIVIIDINTVNLLHVYHQIISGVFLWNIYQILSINQDKDFILIYYLRDRSFLILISRQ